MEAGKMETRRLFQPTPLTSTPSFHAIYYRACVQEMIEGPAAPTRPSITQLPSYPLPHLIHPSLLKTFLTLLSSF